MARLFLSNSIMKKLLKSSTHTGMKLYSVPFYGFFPGPLEDRHVLQVYVPTIMRMGRIEARASKRLRLGGNPRGRVGGGVRLQGGAHERRCQLFLVLGILS